MLMEFQDLTCCWTGVRQQSFVRTKPNVKGQNGPVYMLLLTGAGHRRGLDSPPVNLSVGDASFGEVVHHDVQEGGPLRYNQAVGGIHASSLRP